MRKRVEQAIGNQKERTVQQVLHKGKNISEKYSWTIYFLVDLKIVYILTYAYISIVNLISSTAKGEATSDTESLVLFNVTLFPEHRNVEVASISDAILWNCRNQSVTNHYYKFLYRVLIIIMSAALGGFLVSKLIALFTVSCLCKECSSSCCACIFNDYGLTKLWHIAILEQLRDSKVFRSQSQQQQPQNCHKNPQNNNETQDVQVEVDINKNNINTGQYPSDTSHFCQSIDLVTKAKNKSHDKQLTPHDSKSSLHSIPNGQDPQSNNETQAVQVKVDINENNVNTGQYPSDTSHFCQSIDLVTEAKNKSHDKQLTPHDSKSSLHFVPNGQDIKPGQIHNGINFEPIDYQPLLSEEVTNDIFKGLGCCLKCTDFCRQSLPKILLLLLVVILGLSYLSYDLHPLACVVGPAEDFISYNATKKRVELKFSSHLRDFQKATGIVVTILAIIFLRLAAFFHWLSLKVVEDIKSKAKIRIDEKTKQLESLYYIAHSNDK